MRHDYDSQESTAVLGEHFPERLNVSPHMPAPRGAYLQRITPELANFDTQEIYVGGTNARFGPRPSESITYGLKRVVDIVASGVLFVFLLPFMIIVWCLVRVTSAGPGLHWSWRVGFGGHMFWMPKFRTMPVGTRQIAREAFGVGGVATTSIGQFLRKLSIDELPQLWSVVVGDMSLVGPRPLLGNDPTTAIRQRRFPQCFNVRPGITGLAQVNGRNSVKPLAKARYDAFYAGRCSFDIDVHILLATARAVLDVRRIL